MDKDYFIFVGRLSAEKGCKQLIEGWLRYIGDDNNYRLLICGEGKERISMEESVKRYNERQYIGKNANLSRVFFEGQMSHEDIMKKVAGAKALIVPSLWYEGCPMVIIEAFSLGIPVIASNIGNVGEAVEEGYNGVKFNPHDTNSFVSALKKINSLDYSFLCKNARHCYNSKYSESINIKMFKDIYSSAKVYN